MYRGLLLDDRDQEAYLVDYLVEDKGPGLSMDFCLANRPLEEMAAAVIDFHPDLLALDYRLDEAQGTSDVGVRYKAGPLAQQLRDRASEIPTDDFPIVLVSQEQNIKGYYQPDLTTHDLFDCIYVKGDVVENKNRVGQELLALVEGYKAIIDAPTGDSRLSSILGLVEGEEADSILNHQELRQWHQLTAPHQLARAVLRYIINRNGLLFDRVYLLASLGIDPESPDVDKLIKVLSSKNLDYRGIFHNGWERWWSHRLDIFGESVCDEELGNLSARRRTECLNSRFDLKLIPARSRWTDSDEMYPGCACASCGHPTEKIHSVAAFDSAPSFVERKRICWHCIATGEYHNHDLSFDDSETYIVNKIQNGEIQKEA